MTPAELWRIAACSAAAVVFAANAQAAASSSGVVQAVADCRPIADSASRLACYDKAAGALETARTHGDVVVVDRAEVRAVRRQSFGFQLPSLMLFPHAPTDEGVDHVTATLDHAGRTPDGKWAMTTQEGATWIQTDGQDPYPEPHTGAKMTVRKGALGSFFCSLDGHSAMRCKREI